MLTNLHIKNFRMLADLEITKLGRVNLIVGKNNSGKSTVLEALQIYAGNAKHEVLEEIAITRGEKYATKPNEIGDPKATLPFQHYFTGRQFPETDHTTIEIGSLSEKLTIEHTFQRETEKQFTNRDQNVQWTNNDGQNVYFVSRETVSKSKLGSLQPGDVIRQVLEIRKNDKPCPPIYLDLPGPSQSPYSLRQENYDKPCGVISTQLLSQEELDIEWGRIDDVEDEEIVKRALQIITPDYESLKINRNADGQSDINVKLSSFPKYVPLKSLGDGVLRILQLALKLVSANGGFLLMDEFENGLHYSVQEQVWRMIFKLSNDLNIQVFAATHSWDCIESFAKAAIESPEDGVLLKLSKSRLTSDHGKIIATVYDEEALKVVTASQLEVR
ncbi:MAG: AAA family ATPase [Methylococcales bacterium]|nr:AAA family ATPase [Methylococcales bacterium]